MARAGNATPNAGNGDQPREDSVVSQLIGMAAALWASRQRGKVILLLVALVAVVGASAYAQILLNAWNQPFYDALSRKDVSAFIVQLGVFAELAGVLLVLNVAQAWLNLKSKLVLRKGLVEDLTAEWLAPLRAVRLSQAGEIGENPDQRIHEDARHLTELSTDLGIGLLQSSRAAVELRRRVVDPVRQRWSSRSPDAPLSRRATWSGARCIYSGDRVAGELARRPSADPSEHGALCAGGAVSLRPRAGERGDRRRHPRRRRS